MRALYAGSFDPITNGHIDIILQALRIFDKVIVGIAFNPRKQYVFTRDEREFLVIESLKDTGVDIKNRIEVVNYDGLTVEHADKLNAPILVRGLRAVSDFDIEFQMTLFNRRLPPGCNTVFFMPDEKNFYLSSTAIRDIAKMGGDISAFVPNIVSDLYAKKLEKD
jgi:pantetheine-phosphate adenylyltransferase